MRNLVEAQGPQLWEIPQTLQTRIEIACVPKVLEPSCELPLETGRYQSQNNRTM